MSVTKSSSFCIVCFRPASSLLWNTRMLSKLIFCLFCPFPFRKSSTLPECFYFSNANLSKIVLLNFWNKTQILQHALIRSHAAFTVEPIDMCFFFSSGLMLYAYFYYPWLWFLFLFIFYHYFIFYGLSVRCHLPKRDMTGLKCKPRFYCKSGWSFTEICDLILECH